MRTISISAKQVVCKYLPPIYLDRGMNVRIIWKTFPSVFAFESFSVCKEIESGNGFGNFCFQQCWRMD